MAEPLKLWSDPDVFLIASGRAGLGLSNALDANTYLIHAGPEAVLIDAGAGDSAAALAEAACRGLDITPTHLLLTHGHADHAGGVAGIRRRWPACLVLSGPTLSERWASDSDPVALERAKRAGVYPNDFALTPPVIDRELHDGERFAMGRWDLMAWHMPGHTPEHMVYTLTTATGEVLMFSGDHLFPGGYVAIEPIPGCDVLAYSESMRRTAGIAHVGLLAGHLRPALSDNGESARRATAAFSALSTPRNLGDALA